MKKSLYIILISLVSLVNTSVKANEKVVFITGSDQGDNTYYRNARAYFTEHNYEVVNTVFSLEGMLEWLNEHGQVIKFDEVHVVSHSNAWRGLSLSITNDGERITSEVLNKAFNEGKLPAIEDVLKQDAKIIFHSCGLGENTELLLHLKRAFSCNGAPAIYASPMFNVFGGKYAKHYLSEVYYGYYPTAESPGRYALAKEFSETYPKVNLDWRKALATKNETNIGTVYTYQFNIPVEWEFEFASKKDIPLLENREEIMNWMIGIEEVANELLAFEIPIEKFRWRTSVKDNRLTVKAKTTVLCVMKPVMNNGFYTTPELTNKQLYTSL